MSVAAIAPSPRDLVQHHLDRCPPRTAQRYPRCGRLFRGLRAFRELGVGAAPPLLRGDGLSRQHPARGPGIEGYPVEQPGEVGDRLTRVL